MKRCYCLTLDLKDDPKLIAEYKKYHEKIWPEITASLRDSGIEDAEIYLFGTRMFMILGVNDDFSFESKAQTDQEKSESARMGRVNVEISAAAAWIQRGQEMALNGTNLQAGTMSAGSGVKSEAQ